MSQRSLSLSIQWNNFFLEFLQYSTMSQTNCQFCMDQAWTGMLFFCFVEVMNFFNILLFVFKSGIAYNKTKTRWQSDVFM